VWRDYSRTACLQQAGRWLAAAGLAVAALGACACSQSDGTDRRRIEPVYEQTTGRLQLLRYDSDGDGVVDTFSYMDGSRVVRIEIDSNRDGTIDRWEYYGSDQALVKVGLSRANDGKEDAWSYPGPDGSVARIEISTRRDGTIDRVEHFVKNVLVSAEQDTDGDGRVDTWETYEGDRLAAVAFDSQHRGTPDRRIIYDSSGGSTLEVDPSGDGRFGPSVPESSAAVGTRRRSAGSR
jgi:hypothetical protein